MVSMQTLTRITKEREKKLQEDRKQDERSHIALVAEKCAKDRTTTMPWSIHTMHHLEI